MSSDDSLSLEFCDVFVATSSVLVCLLVGCKHPRVGGQRFFKSAFGGVLGANTNGCQLCEEW